MRLVRDLTQQLRESFDSAHFDRFYGPWLSRYHAGRTHEPADKDAADKFKSPKPEPGEKIRGDVRAKSHRLKSDSASGTLGKGK